MEELLSRTDRLNALLSSDGWQMVREATEQFIADCELEAMNGSRSSEARVHFLEQIKGARLVLNAPKIIQGQIAAELAEYGYESEKGERI